jgi:hypothetical protein
MASGDLGCVVFGGVILNEGRHTQVVRAAAAAAAPPSAVKWHAHCTLAEVLHCKTDEFGSLNSMA